MQYYHIVIVQGDIILKLYLKSKAKNGSFGVHLLLSENVKRRLISEMKFIFKKNWN